VTRFLRAARPRRPSATTGSHHLAGLRPADDPDWIPPWRRGPAYDPADDPCGAPPIGEDARRRAVITLIATMGRHLK
jgi:hypothetical protein